MLYPDILADAFRALGRHFGRAVSDAEARAFGQSVKDWPAFPDSAAALAYLKRHYKLAILSNIDRASFAHSNRRLGVEFDLVVTAEDVGSYKPTPRNFEVLLERMAALGVPKERLLHTAESLYHDHVPAKRFGLATAWIYRRAAKGNFGATRAPDRAGEAGLAGDEPRRARRPPPNGNRRLNATPSWLRDNRRRGDRQVARPAAAPNRGRPAGRPYGNFVNRGSSLDALTGYSFAQCCPTTWQFESWPPLAQFSIAADSASACEPPLPTPKLLSLLATAAHCPARKVATIRQSSALQPSSVLICSSRSEKNAELPEETSSVEGE